MLIWEKKLQARQAKLDAIFKETADILNVIPDISASMDV
jgi:hypothetical protein